MPHPLTCRVREMSFGFLLLRTYGSFSPIAMPRNRFIYWGIVTLVATVSLWLGAELTKRVEYILPYTGGLAIAMIIGGFVYEWRKTRKLRTITAEPVDLVTAPPKAAASDELLKAPPDRKRDPSGEAR
jgi:hypothetical protein